MLSRDSGQWRHLSKLWQNLNECTTFSRPESTYWNNVTVTLFFHKRWWLKKKKFPNRRTVLAWAWSDRCRVTSRRFWPAVYWKKSDPVFFSGEIHSCQCPMSSFKEKKREILENCCSRERGTSWSRKLSSLRPRITVFFFSKDYHLAQAPGSTQITRTLATDSNFVLTRSITNFCFPSDHFNIILPSLT